MAKRRERVRREHRKRREERVNVALPVRVVVLEQERREFACTLDVTSKGARLAGLRGVDLVGEVLEIERGRKKDRFKVVWVGEQGTSREGQIGVLCEGAGTPIWEGLALQPPAYPEQSIAAEGRAPLVMPPWFDELPEHDPESRRKQFRFLAGAVIALCIIVVLAARTGSGPAALPSRAPIPTGMDPQDAQHIRNLGGWRLAQASDFDSDGLIWLNNQGLVALGHIPASFTRDGAQHDSAYLLVPSDPQRTGTHRLVMLINRESRFDTSLPQVAFMLRVPRANIGSIEWLGGAKAVQADGDGVLVVRRSDDPSSGSVFFPQGVRVFSMNPKDYRSVSLR